MPPIPAYLIPLPSPTLGFVPVAVPAAQAGPNLGGKVIQYALDSVLSLVGIGSSDPVKDRERIARIDNEFQGALSGDPNNIACLRDMAQGVSSGPNDPRQCAVGSRVAAAWAKRRWLEYQARAAAAGIGIDLLGQSGIVGPTIARVASNPIVWIVVGAGIFLLLRRRH